MWFVISYIYYTKLFYKIQIKLKFFYFESIEKNQFLLYNLIMGDVTQCKILIIIIIHIKVLYGIDAHHRGQIMLFYKLIQLSNEIIGNDTIKKLQFINEL